MPKMCANRSLTSSVLHLKGGTLIISFTRRVFYMVKRFISITMLQMKAMKMIEKNNCCDEGDCLYIYIHFLSKYRLLKSVYYKA